MLLEITVQLPGEVPEGEWLKGNQLWLPSCRNCRGVRREKIGIVATKLLKMGGGKKKRERELWQPSCRKLGEKFNMQK